MQLSNHAQMLIGGEYALGLLPATASKRWERLMAAQPELAMLTAQWQQQLAPLASWLPERAAPASLWQSIEMELFGTQNRATDASLAATPSALASTASVTPLKAKRPLAWFAAAAMAAGVSLWLALPNIIAPVPTATVAIQTYATLSNEHDNAQWQIALATANTLRVQLNGTWSPTPQRDLELWAIGANGTPVSLGVLALTQNVATLKLSAEQQGLLRTATLLALSDEPTGGSPTALPTGPVLFTGKPKQG